MVTSLAFSSCVASGPATSAAINTATLSAEGTRYAGSDLTYLEIVPDLRGYIPLGRIDINTATEKELTTVPGIGHVMAARIIAARPFRSADDLKRVSGIADINYAKIRPYFQ